MLSLTVHGPRPLADFRHRMTQTGRTASPSAVSMRPQAKERKA
jgi:hypothetical protein